jgi:hypothetical protein
VKVARVGPVRQQRLPAVDRLQQQEVGDVRHASRTRLTQPRGQSLGPLTEHADQFGSEVAQQRAGGGTQARRYIALVQQHPAVCLDFDDPCQADAGVAGHLAAFEQVAQPKSAYAQFRRHRAV